MDTKSLCSRARPPGPSLPLDRTALIAAIDRGEPYVFRTFYGHTPRKDGAISDAVFSQFWPCSFEIDGVRYRWAEQWMMSGKARLFDDGEALQKILHANEPLECKQLGRTVRNFDEGRWRDHRFDLVTRGNVAKFDQDPALRSHLLATEDAILVEAAPRDVVWGIGLGASNPDAHRPQAWRGLNLLGFALVRARGILRGELPAV